MRGRTERRFCGDGHLLVIYINYSAPDKIQSFVHFETKANEFRLIQVEGSTDRSN